MKKISNLLTFYKNNIVLKYYLFIEFYILETNSIFFYDWINKVKPPQHPDYATMRMCFGNDERDFTWMDPERNFITWTCFVVHRIFHRIVAILFPTAAIIHEYLTLFIELFNMKIIPIIYLILILNYTLKFEATLLIFFFTIFVYLLYLNIFNLIDTELHKLILTNYLNFKEQTFIRKNKLKSLRNTYFARLILKYNVKKLIKKFLKYFILTYNLNIFLLDINIILIIYFNILLLTKTK